MISLGLVQGSLAYIQTLIVFIVIEVFNIKYVAINDFLPWT